jgi:hypothetical protein
MATITWTPELLASIPDELLHSEAARRRGRKRQTYTGGVYWKQHNPDVPNCRCARCMTNRAMVKG